MDYLWIINFLLYLLFTLASLQTIRFVALGSRTSSVKLPPGPLPLPILGNLLNLGDKPHKSLAKLAKTHGPLMTLRLGRITTIIVSSPELAKQVLQKHDLTFSNRNIFDAIRAYEHHKVGMPWLPVGAPWRNLRRICNSYIFTNQKLDANQHLRRKKIEQLIDEVRESRRAGEAVDICKIAFKTSLNVLSNVVFSLDLTDSSSETVREFKEVVSCIMEEAGTPNLADYFPILRKIDPQGLRRRTMIYFGKMLHLFDQLIDERLELRKMKGYTTADDILDTLLTISQDNSEEMDRNSIKHLFLDLFTAGTDTTSSTVEWAMAELLRNPKTLSKAKLELQQKIDKDKLLEESDITQLPYLQAIIKETFRFHPVGPLLLPRKAGADVEMGGFVVPKDAQVFVNVWAIGRDPNLWQEPNSFMPERFLGSEIDFRGRHFELIPFGGGRRICPGLPMAMRMIPLMLGSLIHCFDWKLEDGATPENMDMEEKFGISLKKLRPLLAVPI